MQDQRPVVMLTSYNGLPLTSVTALKALAARGEVRYAFLAAQCGAHTLKDRRGVRGGVALGSRPRNRCVATSRPGLQRHPLAAALETDPPPNRHHTTRHLTPMTDRNASVITMNATTTPASLHILVVDDEASLRDTLTRSFSKEGHPSRLSPTGPKPSSAPAQSSST